MSFSKKKTFTLKLTPGQVKKMLRSSDEEGDAKAKALWSEKTGKVTVEVTIHALPRKNAPAHHQAHEGEDHGRGTHQPTHLPIWP